MKKSIAHIAFTAFFIGAICFYGCGEKSKDRPADNIVWIKNQYATLFRVGYTTTDSFLELLSDPQTQKSVGRFFWGRSESVRGYQKIIDRHRIVSLSAIHTGMLTELNAHVDLVGVESKKYIAHPIAINHSALPNGWFSK